MPVIQSLLAGLPILLLHLGSATLVWLAALALYLWITPHDEFALIRAGLALIPAIALNYPIKKWAAFVAIAGALFYTLLAGATVPTQRSFVMMGLVLAAIIFDRQGISMRFVAIAATVILAFQPEALLNASFQMSFAAVVALTGIAWGFEESWQKANDARGTDLIVTERSALEAVSIDQHRRHRGVPLALALPRTVADVTSLLAFCNAARIGVVPQGGNTGMVVGSTPDTSGTQVVLSLQLPFAVVPLVLFTADKRKMGELTAPLWVTALAALTALIIITLNVKLLVDLATG